MTLLSIYLTASVVAACGLTVSASSGGTDGRRKAIIDGNVAAIDAFPWFSAPTYRQCSGFNCEDTLTWNLCGGVLVAPDFVLTAAHCPNFPNGVANPGFRVGAYCIDPEDTDLEFNCGQELEFRSRVSITGGVFTPPGWNEERGSDDFRLHQLEDPVSIEPIALDDGSVTLTAGDKLSFVGLGVTEDGGDPAERLQEMEMEVFGADDAFDLWDNNPNGRAIPRSLRDIVTFAGSSSAAVCDGDSGGPLIKDGVLVGILSFSECLVGASAPPAGFGKVSLAYSWIKEVVCANTAADPLPSYCGSSCKQGEESKFNKRKKDSDKAPKVKKCLWLEKKEKRKSKFCTEKYDAPEICDVSCSLCTP